MLLLPGHWQSCGENIRLAGIGDPLALVNEWWPCKMEVNIYASASFQFLKFSGRPVDHGDGEQIRIAGVLRCAGVTVCRGTLQQLMQIYDFTGLGGALLEVTLGIFYSSMNLIRYNLIFIQALSSSS